MNPITLFCSAFFPPKPFDDKTESNFLRDYSERYVIRRQVTGILGLCINLVYFGIDVFNAGNDEQFKLIFMEAILPLRLAGNAVFVVAIGLLFRPLATTSERYASFCVTFCFLSCYVMLLALTYAEPFPEHYFFYYEGMLLIILYLCGLSRILAKPTLMLICWVLFLTFLTFITDENSMAIANLEARTDKEHNTPFSFLVIFSIVGYFMALEQERTACHTFLREQDLQRVQLAIKNSTDEIIKLKERARLQAEQQNRDKSKFIANAAHDLRNAMQPTGIFLDLANKALSSNDLQQTQGYVNEAVTANKALRSDINAILDISELDAGFISLKYSAFDVRELAAEVLTEIKPFADEYNVKLHFSKNRAMKAIGHSDRHHLKRILTNVLVNAIKYADPGKGETARAGIAIVSHNRKIRIDVIDNGIGIPHAEQDNVFSPLYQLNNPNRDREQGKGLGLSIVKTTLDSLHQHTFKLRSKPAIGTRFSLSLPKGDSMIALVPLLTNDVDISLSGLYVLLIENDPLVQRSLIALLQNQGAEFEAVGSVEDLQRLLPNLERNPDIVVSDYRLNGNATAKEVIAAINAQFGDGLQILILSGETTDLSGELPGRTILHKPVEPRQLLVEIHRLSQP